MAHPGWFALLLATTSILGQSAPRALATSRDRAITFPTSKPVLGLPLGTSWRQGLCSSDGLTYFNPPSNSTGNTRVLDLYSVATSGEVRHLLQTVPIEYTNVFKRDFFAGDSALVTLIEAQKRNGSDPEERPTEIQYYLSISDHDGDSHDLVALDMHFKPLKAARLGSGDFIVLGWQEGNRLAQLAVLKEDGTLRRFIDWEEQATGSQTPIAASPAETMESLAGAAFVPFGGNVLLTYPGTSRRIHVLNGGGMNRGTSLAFPPGYQLHDVLNSGCCSTIVARAEELPDSHATKSENGPKLRMFEFDFRTGKRIREFTFDKEPISAVTCAADHSLSAIFLQPVGTAADPNKEEQPTQWVVGSAFK